MRNARSKAKNKNVNFSLASNIILEIIIFCGIIITSIIYGIVMDYFIDRGKELETLHNEYARASASLLFYMASAE